MKPRALNYRGLSDQSEDYSFEDGSLFDPNSYLYWDEYGNAWDVLGLGWWNPQDFTADGYDASGNPVLRIDTTDYFSPVNLHELGNTLDWLNVNQGAPVELPAVTYSAGYILQMQTQTIQNDPSAPAILKTPGTWDKIKAALQNIAKNGRATATTGQGGAGAQGKPQILQPSSQGTCPTGYAKNAQGQCQLISQKPAAAGAESLLSNPMFLLLGIIAVAVISKK